MDRASPACDGSRVFKIFLGYKRHAFRQADLEAGALLHCKLMVKIAGSIPAVSAFFLNGVNAERISLLLFCRGRCV